MKFKLLILCCLSSILFSFSTSKTVYLTQNGQIHFQSYAPLELIEANSNELKGAIDITERTFAFTVDITTFEGFNNPLQKEHFNENYLESNDFKTAFFLGKIIEKIDLTKDGAYTLRAKGKLKIHGVEQERIIKSKVVVKDKKMTIESNFTILLKEHDIAIPKIVYQKIAEEIQVTVNAELTLPSS
jgi:hypothetical protein